MPVPSGGVDQQVVRDAHRGVVVDLGVVVTAGVGSGDDLDHQQHLVGQQGRSVVLQDLFREHHQIRAAESAEARVRKVGPTVGDVSGVCAGQLLVELAGHSEHCQLVSQYRRQRQDHLPGNDLHLAHSREAGQLGGDFGQSSVGVHARTVAAAIARRVA